MKKILILGTFAFVFALTASVASANWGGFSSGQSNTAIGVSNSVASVADTGNNTIQKNCLMGTALITTGNATSSASGFNAINGNFAKNLTYGSQSNYAKSSGNEVFSQATTGTNMIEKMKISSGGAEIRTGAALTRARGINLINTSIKLGCECPASAPSCDICD